MSMVWLVMCAFWWLWFVLECEGERGDDGEVVTTNGVAHSDVLECC